MVWMLDPSLCEFLLYPFVILLWCSSLPGSCSESMMLVMLADVIPAAVVATSLANKTYSDESADVPFFCTFGGLQSQRPSGQCPLSREESTAKRTATMCRDKLSSGFTKHRPWP
jgi:hypothetical protein